jgi:arylsulfatase A-like enzyme
VSEAADPPPAPRLVLLYAPCTLTRAHLSPYRPSIPYTPRLQEFASEALTFERHQTEAGSSGIAYASLFSGAQADRHGVFDHPSPMREDVYGLFEAFADAGYDPFYWHDQQMARPGLGYARGVPPRQNVKGALQGGDERFEQVLARLAREPAYRALIVTNMKTTHGPYAIEPLQRFVRAYPELGTAETAAPPHYFGFYLKNHFILSWNLPAAIERHGLDEDALSRLTAQVEALYAANVHELDRQFGAVLDAIEEHGLADRSLVAFTADHGEVLRDDEALYQWSHSLQLAPEVLMVPWLVRAPGVQPGRYAQVTRSIDVYPTLAGLAGVELPADRGIQGVDLSPALRGQAEAPDLEAYSHTSVLPAAVTLQMQNRRLRKNWERVKRFFPRAEVELIWTALRRGDDFHRLRQLEPGDWSVRSQRLSEDPEGSVARPAADAPPDPEAGERLARYKARLVRGFHTNAQPERSPSEDEREKALKALGYIQ